MRQAVAQQRQWQQAGLELVPVAVNLSLKQCLQGDCARLIADTLRNAGLAPQHLKMEITENFLVAGIDVKRVFERLMQIKASGVGLSLDDFGTGYSSLNYLRQFPVSTLKIDKSFIADVNHDPGDANLVRAIIAMAHSLKIQVVAEGVETLQQKDFLRQHGCEMGQGFLYNRSLPAERFAALLNHPAPTEALCPSN